VYARLYHADLQDTLARACVRSLPRVNFAVLGAKGPVMIKDEEFQDVKKALHLYEDFRQKEKVVFLLDCFV
jgi:transcription antitermination factor NusG